MPLTSTKGVIVKIRQIAGAVVASAALAAGLAACGGGSGAARYETICVDPLTGLRVLDLQCQLNPTWWYYVPYGGYAPAIGYAPRIGYSYGHQPSHITVINGGVPTTGAAKVSPPKTATPKVSTPKQKAPTVKPPKVNVYKAPPKVSRRK
jgi:hypothetical protein